MSLPVLTREQVRRVDQLAIERLGIPGVVLMENAGRGVVDVLQSRGVSGPVVVACGKGNNGGDGFVIARHLAVRGFACQVLLFAKPSDLRGDAAINFHALQALGLPWREVANLADDAESLRLLHDAEWLVDALLGTGAQGNPSAELAAAIRMLNQSPGRRLAVDIPSGLDCDTGIPGEPTLRAEVTCTFVAPKPGLLQAIAKPFVGEVVVLDIGVPVGLWEIQTANFPPISSR